MDLKKLIEKSFAELTLLFLGLAGLILALASC